MFKQVWIKRFFKSIEFNGSFPLGNLLPLAVLVFSLVLIYMLNSFIQPRRKELIILTLM